MRQPRSRTLLRRPAPPSGTGPWGIVKPFLSRAELCPPCRDQLLHRCLPWCFLSLFLGDVEVFWTLLKNSPGSHSPHWRSRALFMLEGVYQSGWSWLGCVTNSPTPQHLSTSQMHFFLTQASSVGRQGPLLFVITRVQGPRCQHTSTIPKAGSFMNSCLKARISLAKAGHMAGPNVEREGKHNPKCIWKRRPKY